MKWNDLTLFELSIIGEQSSEQDLKSKQFYDIHSQIKIRWTRLVSDLNFLNLCQAEYDKIKTRQFSQSLWQYVKKQNKMHQTN